MSGRITIVVSNERGTLGSLTTMIARHLGNINNLKITNRTRDFFEMVLDIEVDDAAHLTDIIAALRATPAVTSVERAQGPELTPRRKRRQAGRSDAGPLEAWGEHRPRRDRPERPRWRSSRYRQGCTGGRHRRCGRHHRPFARRQAAYDRCRYRAADRRHRPAAQPGDGRNRGDVGNRAAPTVPMRPASCPSAAPSGRRRAGSMRPAR